MKSKQLTNIRAAGKDVRPPTMRLLVLADVLLADFTAGHNQAHASPRADSRGLHRVRCPTNMLRAAFERSYCCEITLCCRCRYIADDELVEVTPKIVRLRKKKLDPTERKKLVRQTL